MTDDELDALAEELAANLDGVDCHRSLCDLCDPARQTLALVNEVRRLRAALAAVVSA